MWRNRADRRRQFPPFPTIQQRVSYTISDPESGNKIRLTFSAPVSITSIPLFRRINSEFAAMADPTGYTVVSPTVVDLEYAAPPLAVSFAGYFPDNTPEVQAVTGGYVTSEPQGWFPP